MRRFMFLISSLSLLAPASFAQHLISFGITGGVPLTDAFSDTTTMGVDTITHSFSSSKNYVVGPMAELRLPFGFAVEADALYRPLNLTVNTTVIPSLSGHSSNNISSWEFPILGKYHYLHVPLVSPYVEAGPVFRALGSSGSYLSNHGFTIGSGVDIKLFLVRISPEIRFTRWGQDATVTGYAQLNSFSNVNQAEFLVGLSF